MVDLYDLVVKFYYHPLTDGSNSIKDVLPAVLQASLYLQDKYSKPIYGTDDGIKSLNFKNQIWLSKKGNEITSPYKFLPELFKGVEFDAIDLITDEDDAQLRDGGAAMTAYARMQFTEMSDLERNELASALLKYCELDTLAMVMIYEYLREELKTLGKFSTHRLD